VGSLNYLDGIAWTC